MLSVDARLKQSRMPYTGLSLKMILAVTGSVGLGAVTTTVSNFAVGSFACLLHSDSRFVNIVFNDESDTLAADKSRKDVDVVLDKRYFPSYGCNLVNIPPLSFKLIRVELIHILLNAETGIVSVVIGIILFSCYWRPVPRMSANGRDTVPFIVPM